MMSHHSRKGGGVAHVRFIQRAFDFVCTFYYECVRGEGNGGVSKIRKNVTSHIPAHLSMNATRTAST